MRRSACRQRARRRDAARDACTPEVFLRPSRGGSREALINNQRFPEEASRSDQHVAECHRSPQRLLDDCIHLGADEDGDAGEVKPHEQHEDRTHRAVAIRLKAPMRPRLAPRVAPMNWAPPPQSHGDCAIDRGGRAAANRMGKESRAPFLSCRLTASFPSIWRRDPSNTRRPSGSVQRSRRAARTGLRSLWVPCP